MTLPAIVLVRPQLGVNIGATARAMMNFGLTDLRLVSPRDGWPNPEAGPAASGADEILASAQLFSTLSAALADCNYSYATTVRNRSLTKPVVTPRHAAGEVRERAGRAAFVFGGERSGLLTDDLALVHAIVTIPTQAAFGSLNLAQAVLVMAYECHMARTDVPACDLRNYSGPAAHEELEKLVTHLTAELDKAEYFHAPDRKRINMMTVRNLVTRPAYSAEEVRTWRGIITSLASRDRG